MASSKQRRAVKTHLELVVHVNEPVNEDSAHLAGHKALHNTSCRQQLWRFESRGPGLQY